jgi:hypothetical protein
MSLQHAIGSINQNNSNIKALEKKRKLIKQMNMRMIAEMMQLSSNVIRYMHLIVLSPEILIRIKGINISQ